MSAPVDTTLVSTIAIGALVAWRLYARLRRVIGRQRLSPIRPWINVILFPLLLLAVLLGSLGHPTAAGALVAGAIVGVVLGLYGTHSTRFEATPAGLFYTPNTHLGVALSVLLVLRLAYRAWQWHALGQGGDASQFRFGHSPLTLGILGTLAGYYVTYAVGLLRWRARMRPET